MFLAWPSRLPTRVHSSYILICCVSFISLFCLLPHTDLKVKGMLSFTRANKSDRKRGEKKRARACKGHAKGMGNSACKVLKEPCAIGFARTRCAMGPASRSLTGLSQETTDRFKQYPYVTRWKNNQAGLNSRNSLQNHRTSWAIQRILSVLSIYGNNPKFTFTTILK